MKIFVIGDDLTGCNATGALYVQAGFQTITVWSESILGSDVAEADVVILNTNSRLESPEAAYEKVLSALSNIKVDPIISKRIDSTFRGNIGIEIEAIFDSLNNDYPGRIIRCLVVPAFPDAGRTTKGGIHYLNEVPIDESEVNTDRNHALQSSRIVDLIGSQSSRSVAEVPLSIIESSEEQLFQYLRTCQADLVICDAVTNQHIRDIARAAARVEKVQAVHWISADPGPFSVALTQARSLHPTRKTQVVLSFVASHTDMSVRQVEFTKLNIGAQWIKVNTKTLEIKEIVEQINELIAKGSQFIGIDFADPESNLHDTQAISNLSRELTDSINPSAVYASGGETAAAVLLGLEATAFNIDFEILPLAVSGRIIGGPYEDLPFATKGGLIGDLDATVACLKHLIQVNTYRSTQTHINRKAVRS